MRKMTIQAIRRTAGMAAIGGVVAGTMLGGANLAVAADMPGAGSQQSMNICGQNVDDVVLFDAKGRPTIPARTPFFYCVTGETLLPGQIPPPPEYCCK